MSRYTPRSRTDPFTDLLFNALMGFTFLFFIAIIFLNPVAKSGIIDPKAEYIVTIGWQDFNPDDIDLWVQNPRGGLVWFRNPEAGLLHLDRDDRGTLNDVLVIDGREVVNPLNQEVVTLRGVAPGEYVVNLHYYASQSLMPVEVNVRVAKVNPKLEIVYYGVVTLEKAGEEKTAVRFTVGGDGRIVRTSTLPKKLVHIEH